MYIHIDVCLYCIRPKTTFVLHARVKINNDTNEKLIYEFQEK